MNQQDTNWNMLWAISFFLKDPDGTIPSFVEMQMYMKKCTFKKLQKKILYFNFAVNILLVMKTDSPESSFRSYYKYLIVHNKPRVKKTTK